MKIEKKKKITLHPGVFLLVGLLLTGILASTAYAKYIHENDGDKVAIADKFYFCSDLLGNGLVHTYAAGTEEITFTVGNHADQLRYSELPVYYTITVEEKTSVTENTSADETAGEMNAISEEKGPTIAAADATNQTGSTVSGNTLEGNIADTSGVQDNEIKISGLESGKSYKVTAKGSSIDSSSRNEGYHKTLTATFTILPDDSGVYQYVDTKTDANYVLLTVWSKGYSGEVSITYPEGLIPDNTDGVDAMREATTDGSGGTITDKSTFTYKGNSDSSSGEGTGSGTDGLGYNSHVYRFFKDATPGETTKYEFTVTYYINNISLEAPVKEPE
jgi:hypothetical protein